MYASCRYKKRLRMQEGLDEGEKLVRALVGAVRAQPGLVGRALLRRQPPVAQHRDGPHSFPDRVLHLELWVRLAGEHVVADGEKLRATRRRGCEQPRPRGQRAHTVAVRYDDFQAFFQRLLLNAVINRKYCKKFI